MRVRSVYRRAFSTAVPARRPSSSASATSSSVNGAARLGADERQRADRRARRRRSATVSAGRMPSVRRSASCSASGAGGEQRVGDRRRAAGRPSRSTAPGPPALVDRRGVALVVLPREARPSSGSLCATATSGRPLAVGDVDRAPVGELGDERARRPRSSVRSSSSEEDEQLARPRRAAAARARRA